MAGIDIIAPGETVLLMGNEAIARGALEAGIGFAASYPGTPASEIMDSLAPVARETGIYAEWSVNEKVAYDNALAASIAGKRSAVAMKQVGLNVAADSLMSSAYQGVIGGMLIVSCDDPGPHSSQTEQDSRFFAMFAKVPAYDPSTPQEAMAMIKDAYDLSEAYQIPVIFRPTIRLSHGKQSVQLSPPEVIERPANFEKDPGRWALPRRKKA